MKRLLGVIGTLGIFLLAGCSSDFDYEGYTAAILNFESEFGAESFFGEFPFVDEQHQDVLLEDMLLAYSDISLQFDQAYTVLDNLDELDGDSKVYDAMESSLQDLQRCYTNDLHAYVMQYAKIEKKNTTDQPWMNSALVSKRKAFDTCISKIEKQVYKEIEAYEQRYSG